MMIRTYRVRGHLEAQLDPLGLTRRPSRIPNSTRRTHGFTEADLDRPIFIDHVLGRETATVTRDPRHPAARSYCGPIGVEFMHIQDPEQKVLDPAPRRGRALEERRYDAEVQEDGILQPVGGGRGVRGVLPEALRHHQAVRPGGRRGHHPRAARHDRARRPRTGVNEVAIGMPHRGRLNTLVNIVKKPFTALFSEFGGESFKPDDVQGSGDVKYHLGTSTDIDVGRADRASVAAAQPVAPRGGRSRRRRQGAGAAGHAPATPRPGSVMAILMHGDAAFAGRGWCTRRWR